MKHLCILSNIVKGWQVEQDSPHRLAGYYVVGSRRKRQTLSFAELDELHDQLLRDLCMYLAHQRDEATQNRPTPDNAGTNQNTQADQTDESKQPSKWYHAVNIQKRWIGIITTAIAGNGCYDMLMTGVDYVFSFLLKTTVLLWRTADPDSLNRAAVLWRTIRSGLGW